SIEHQKPPPRPDRSSIPMHRLVNDYVKRQVREDIYVPPFQRDYVWTIREASRFIESLLLGLPVPGVFLSKQADSKRLLVIDGQQRLKTLRFFFEGVFIPDTEANTQRVFKLSGVQEQYEGRTYETLEEDDRITLNDTIIHATIVKQESPTGDDTSIFHIFERLNTSGRKLSAQQIRVAIYQGDVLEMLRELNEDGAWRAIYGKRSRTLKDEELILRFMAMYFDRGNYSRPMSTFLNNFCVKAAKKFQSKDEKSLTRSASEELFKASIKLVFKSVGEKAFRRGGSLNAALFDSVMVGISTRLATREKKPDKKKVKAAYDELLLDDAFIERVTRSTADKEFVKERTLRAITAFEAT
ncbi:MAG: hypothetical protein ACI92S_003636, partial [Planctomycetaceae bacterium]